MQCIMGCEDAVINTGCSNLLWCGEYCYTRNKMRNEVPGKELVVCRRGLLTAVSESFSYSVMQIVFALHIHTSR